MMLLTGARATAQDALWGSLAYDQAAKPRENATTNLGPEQTHLGPVQVSLGCYGEVDFTDNVTFSEVDQQSDFILRGGGTASFSWPATPQSEVTLNTGVGYIHYLRDSQYDNLEITPNSLLNWNVFIDDVALTFYDQFGYSQSVAGQPALTGVSRFPIFDNTLGTRINWTPGQWLFQAGYSYDESLPGSSAFSYLERTTENIFTRAAWRFAENTQVGLEASGSSTSYRLATQSGNTSVSVGPFAEWQVTQAVHATIRGGPTFYFFDSSGAANQGSSLGSYYFELQVGHQMNEFWSQQLSVNREVSLAFNQGGNYLESLTANYTLSWALTQYINLTANAGYAHGTQTFQNFVSLFPGFGLLLNQTENYDQYSAGPTVSWQATSKLSTSLNFTHYIRDSNLPGRAYTANIISLKVNYAF